MLIPKSGPFRRNPVGTISLSVVALGFTAVEAAHYTWGGESMLWSLVRAGLEAAVIGGVADWFAVTALFYPIPNSRFPLPATDLVIQNRDKLTDGLVDMVENHLLSPASVKERLNEFSLSQLVISQLDTPSGRAIAADALRSLAGRFSAELEDVKLQEFITDLLREQIRRAELGTLLGQWLEARIVAGDTNLFWNSLAETLADQVEAGAFDEFIEEALSVALKNYKAEANWIKRTAVSWVVNPGKETIAVRAALSRLLHEQAHLKDHPLNQKLDNVVREYAHRLIAKDDVARHPLRALQERLADHADLEHVVGHMMSDLRCLVQSRISDSPKEVNKMLEESIMRGVVKLKSDNEARQKLDDWARTALQDLVARYHSVIGATARDSVNRLKNEELVAQLESKVGHDLQYIRLNGAIVGSLVGVAIAGFRLCIR